jgi:hypothetical protein
MEQALSEQVRAAIERHQQVRLAREGIAARNVHCFPFQMAGELLLVQEVDDFALDGYAVLRLRDVTEVRSGECERFCERVLEGEGVLAQVRPPEPPVALASWPALFASLQAAPWPLVILDSEEYEDEPMYVGRVVGAGADAVSFRYVDALGAWDAEPDGIPYEDITAVRFGDRYTTILARYIPPPAA